MQLRPRVTVLALGGASWVRLGSDGAWVPWLRERGVPVAEWQPANMGFAVDWSPHMARFFGVPVKGAALCVGGQRERGEFVISARGIEGGGVYAVSRALREGSRLELDLMPDLPEANLSDTPVEGPSRRKHVKPAPQAGPFSRRCRADPGIRPSAAGRRRARRADQGAAGPACRTSSAGRGDLGCRGHPGRGAYGRAGTARRSGHLRGGRDAGLGGPDGWLSADRLPCDRSLGWAGCRRAGPGWLTEGACPISRQGGHWGA